MKAIYRKALIALFILALVELFVYQRSMSVSYPSTLENYHPPNYSWNTTSVRRWGCHRNETPFIFVHIGKAGGGSTRVRFAAAAQDYTRTEWRSVKKDQHYYPLPGGKQAKFCNSLNRNHRWQESPASYEKNLPCSATTPIGMALACPGFSPCLGCDNPRSPECHTVYVGHNHLGSEFNWLPAKYLQTWWKFRGKQLLNTDRLDGAFQALEPQDSSWCQEQNKARPQTTHAVNQLHELCGIPVAARIDALVRENYVGDDFAPIYASLPLQRTVVLREPWAWLLSKFFWHGAQNRETNCDDIVTASQPTTGWAFEYLARYMVVLCGDDCFQRLQAGQMSLQQVEEQAASNLRQSFSVVGLLEELDTFYDMVTKRVAYMDMSLNANQTGNEHSVKKGQAYQYCKQRFADDAFRDRFRVALPLISAVERLYQLAVQVNRFQQQELLTCT